MTLTTSASNGKTILRSKTFWVNLLSLGGMLASAFFGYTLPAEWTASILAVVNIILRLVTKEEIVW